MRSSRQFVVLGLFILAGFVAYSNILNSYFISDDFSQIGKVLAGYLSVVWGKEHGGFFRPLFILSYLIDTKIWGAGPFGFHLTNIVLHSLNAFLTFVLSLRIVEDLKHTALTKRMISIGAGALCIWRSRSRVSQPRCWRKNPPSACLCWSWGWDCSRALRERTANLSGN